MRHPFPLLPAALAAIVAFATLPIAAPAQTADPAMITVTGQIAYRERIALLPGSVATVIVADVSRADAAAPVLAETTIEGKQVPIPFSLDVPGDRMTARGRYALRATIHDASGALRWTTDSFIPVDPEQAVADLGVLTLVQVSTPATATVASYTCGDRTVSARYTPDSLQLTLDGETRDLVRVRSGSGARYAAEDGTLGFWDNGDTALLETGGLETECVLQETDAAAIVGGSWRVEDINRRGVVDNSQTSLEFGADGTVSGRGGCNRYSGSYTRDGDTITFGPLAVTRMACTPALGEQEQKFSTVLSTPVRVSFDATGALVLTNENGDALLARR